MTSFPNTRPAAILGTAAAAGTIAAVRELSVNGFRVGVMSTGPLCAAAWSRFASASYRVPKEMASEHYCARLLAIGAKDPGQTLLATSDETAWLYTLNADLLAQHFCVYQPSLTTIQRILDKKLFSDAASKAGLAVLPSWDPLNLDELAGIASNLPYPVLIKPRTHVQRLRNDKGVVACSKAELIHEYGQFFSREQSGSLSDRFVPGAQRPLVQQFVRIASEGVCSVSGFIDKTGELFVTRRSTKVFLRSEPVGVGVCFESLPADAALSAAVRRLCRELQYYGLFEVEFIRFNDNWAVIDFNPRLFNQVGMDIYRKMPLPVLACLDAAGERMALRSAVAKAQIEDETDLPVFCDRLTLNMILAARRVTGRISRQELTHWRDWLKRHSHHLVDVAANPVDSMPGVIHAVSEISLGLRAIPRFLRLTSRMPEIAGSTSAKA